MKVIISAYACTPGAGSEPGAGWLWSRAAAMAGHEVWLVTRSNNRAALESALAEEPGLRITPVYVELPSVLVKLKRGPRRTRVYYLLWQTVVRRRITELHETERFDVSHHLTFAIDWLPAGAVGIAGLPGIWGPVGGTGSIPLRLWRWLGIRGFAQEVLRELLVRPLRRFWGDMAAARAALVVAQNHDVAHRFRRAREVWVEPNVAFDTELRYCSKETSGSSRMTAIFVGRLIPLKGLPLAIAALADPRASGWRLHVVGEGPERGRCLRYARRLGVAERVEFFGQLPRAEAIERMRHAHAVVFPSLHDQAPWAVGEALALGLEVVCLDLGGPATMVRLDRGMAVPADGAAARRIASALSGIDREQVSHSVRWSAERLPAFLDAAYRAAVESQG